MGTSVATPIVEGLRERIQRLEGAVTRRRTVLSFGVKEIDRRLPEGGLALGALHEVAGGGNGAVDGAAAGPGAVVRHPEGSLRAGHRSGRAVARPGDLYRGVR